MLNSKFCSCITASWNQFDGVAYVYGDKSMFSRVWDYFTRDKTVEYRTKALLCFLPKWKGFFVNETAEKMNATEALLKLNNVVNCLSKVWIEEKNNHWQVQPSNFDVREVICLMAEERANLLVFKFEVLFVVVGFIELSFYALVFLQYRPISLVKILFNYQLKKGILVRLKVDSTEHCDRTILCD